jgi:hypothetical protein
MILLSVLAAMAVSPSPTDARTGDAEATDIVVVAKKRKCRVQLGAALLSARELDAYAAQWATGVTVRVHVPSNASYNRLATILFRLNDRGVTRAEFVDERTAP